MTEAIQGSDSMYRPAISWVIWDSCIPVSYRVVADFMTASGLPVKGKPKFFDVLDNFSITESR